MDIKSCDNLLLSQEIGVCPKGYGLVRSEHSDPVLGVLGVPLCGVHEGRS